MGSSGPGRVRVERGIYRQPNGKYAVCWRHAGRLRFRTVGFDLTDAQRARLALIAATREGKVPVSPRLRFETVASWWLERFEAKVAAGERHPRTLEAHRYQLDRHLLPALGRRRVAALTVDDVAELLHQLRRAGRSAKTAPSALATLQSVLRFARRRGWVVADPVTGLVAVAHGVARFLAVESCGQCTPCKQDGLAIAERMDVLRRGEGEADDLIEVQARLATVADGARCSLA